jgi:hypothetical protein
MFCKKTIPDRQLREISARMNASDSQFESRAGNRDEAPLFVLDK